MEVFWRFTSWKLPTPVMSGPDVNNTCSKTVYRRRLLNLALRGRGVRLQKYIFGSNDNWNIPKLDARKSKVLFVN